MLGTENQTITEKRGERADTAWDGRSWPDRLRAIAAGARLTDEHALALADYDDTVQLTKVAAALRDRGHGDVISFSKKVFLPLTHLCRDVCHYCTFARAPRQCGDLYMSVDEVLEQCADGAALGCKEALFTLGEKPELRYPAARQALERMGFATTLEYVAHVAGRVLAETSLTPHINAGCMEEDEIAFLRPVSASMGIMLESASERLCEKGMPHHGSPDKEPAVRLATIERAGEARVPFTSGILIGIGETRRERVDALLALRQSHERHGHIQEIIIQNFRAKPGTRMAAAVEPSLDDMLWTIAVARLLFGPAMNIQAPPNLSPDALPQLVAAGINDWGGVSPLTPDFVNPEAPWPHLEQLARDTKAAGKCLEERLTVYPRYVADGPGWLDPAVQAHLLRGVDAQGCPRIDDWRPGADIAPPEGVLTLLAEPVEERALSAELRSIIDHVRDGQDLTHAEIERLFAARGREVAYVCQAADQLRHDVCGDDVTYVVNRNINYTNICYFKCGFCAFSKGDTHEDLRGRPYDLEDNEIARRCAEAWERGATEVCMQGGIHPRYTGQTYLDIIAIVKAAAPEMHIHAFSPLEVWQGAHTLGLPLSDYLRQLREAGLNTLPGTAAEILDDEVRAIICADKINTAQWLQVMEEAHKAGFKTTATIMYGHVEGLRHWARHLVRVREQQQRTGGFTEFVPLPFVPMEAPIYRKGGARMGPTFREAVLMHAVARLALHGAIDNIQTSWVKMGARGAAACLTAGANDLGGTLMNESITRAAGAVHGQEHSPERMERLITALGRRPRQRDTLYRDVADDRRRVGFGAPELERSINTPPQKRAGGDARRLLRNSVAGGA